MLFNLTDIKTFKSRNGYGMTAKFWINNIHVADFQDNGDGGQPFLYINLFDSDATKLFAEFDAAIDELPELYIESFDHYIKIDQYFFIDLLHAALINKTEFKLLAAA